ncbi:metallophosphoesterase [Burkholderia sp. L27(2015)]|uniref:metallophosphoesterase n=1 Tax=Burkholderia sp. L27(2015) TaxID=1641858 RepID=UPI00131D5CB2|nr:metallophosphoesterase [Burkholderia sp. L27(2015)]
MKILIWSDLHNEFEPFTPDVEILSQVDVVVLAGDIGLKDRGVLWAKTWAVDIPKTPVLVVAGNHEFYTGHFDTVIGKMREAATDSNIHILENDELVFDGVRFLGCSLWTDFKLLGASSAGTAVIESIRGSMTDYKKIRTGGNYRKLHPADTMRRHEISRSWLKGKLAEPFAGPTAVITHHAPSARSIPEEFAGDYASAAYASDLESLMGEHAPLWVHGHVHESFDYQLNGTRVVCNPRGYAPKYLNENFKPTLIVTLKD